MRERCRKFAKFWQGTLRPPYPTIRRYILRCSLVKDYFVIYSAQMQGLSLLWKILLLSPVISRLAMDTALPRVLLSIALATLLPIATPDQGGLAKENIPHSRQKRILWITNDGRLALPPGTSMQITPSLSMPLVRHPPKGFLSNMSISFPFTIDFDKLGLTDNENPYGDLPPFLGRSMGRAAVSLMADYIGQYLERRRGKRDVVIAPEVENAVLNKLHGGERALMYGIAEDLMSNFGLSGKECLLRTICEVQAHPLNNFGFLGEIMKLFFTPSKSPYAKLLEEYIEAQKAGESGGECWPYYRLCPKSLFQPASNKYSKEAEEIHRRREHDENQFDENEIIQERAM